MSHRGGTYLAQESDIPVASGKLDPLPLYTHRFDLDQLPEAFEAMRQRPDGFLKAWIVP